ncbi:MAG: phenylalanine--tRNA ligase subunit beta [Nanoarchaeota archaeon]|nr:phenylalanine--tRNA ligase subunit beta [Nanoarchaeota archaeon]MBU1027508.1 phenylalanine--tRNA ligase subunit beta [Nanoarchaeota archaeon]
MANIKFPRKIFEKEIGKLDSKMQEKIAMFGTPLESFNDEEIEIEIFPNRPDFLSYQGFKRSFLAFLGKKTGLKEYKINKPEKDYKVNIESSVKNIRPYTACAIIKNLNLDDEKIKELIEIQEKLHLTIGRKRKKLAIGIYPLEKIKLPITYKALEPDKIKFIPLETNKEMSGLEILQKHPAGKEYSNLLAGKTQFPIFIDANKNILSMPPIINSQLTGKITSKTKEVFVECSGFNFEILNKCLNIIITCLADMGGKIYNMEIKSSKKILTPNLTPSKMRLDLENTNKLLGLNLNEKEIKKLIEKMGHNYNKGIVEIPAWRTDILHEVDLIEDIAITYGYENFTIEVPKIAGMGEEKPIEIFKRKVSEILTGLEFLEVSNYHLTNKTNQFIKMGINEKQEKEFVELKESKTDYNILRKDLTHYILKNFSENVDSEYPQKIFEIGKIFEEKDSIIEKERIAIAITSGNFTEIKQILEYLFRMLDKKIELKEAKELPPHFIEGRTASITLNNKKIGFVGEISPKILKNWKLKMPVALLELNLEEVFYE